MVAMSEADNSDEKTAISSSLPSNGKFPSALDPNRIAEAGSEKSVAAP